MNTINNTMRLTSLAAMLLLSACAADAVKDPGVVKVRGDLATLQSNPDLASRAPLAMQDAETAVKNAEQPQIGKNDQAVTDHLVYVADRKVQAAGAQAQTRFVEDQRKALSDENAKIQLEARTHEADSAKRKNGQLQAENDFAKQKSDMLQAQNDSANQKSAELQLQADTANQKNDALQAQIAALQAKKTDRGLVLTVGDLLFSSGRSDLKPGGIANLDRLVTFLGQAPDRTVRIEGHTDSVGGQAMNQTLSQKRAESVAMYLTGRGIAGTRLTSAGQGFSSPIADNGSAAGRQANRRVEVIVQN